MTTLFGNAAVGLEVETIQEPKKKKQSMLPVLVVLFLISYGLMTMLIVEQGTTIQAQRTLIEQLFGDSTELSAIRMKALKDKQTAQSRHQAPSNQAQSNQTPSTQIPSTQIPSTQAQSETPSTQAPSTQVGPQKRAQSNASKAPKMQVPSRPAADLTDERRQVKMI